MRTYNRQLLMVRYRLDTASYLTDDDDTNDDIDSEYTATTSVTLRSGG